MPSVPKRQKPTLTNRLAAQRWTVAAVGCAAVLHAGGCRKAVEASPAIVIDHQIAPWPAHVGPALVTLRLTDGNGHPVRGASVMLEGDMSHPGMPPEFDATSEIDAGRYQGRLTFTMAGDWVILMHVTLPGGQKLERQMEVKGVTASR